MGKQNNKEETPVSSQPDKNTNREEMKEVIKDRLAAFEETDDSDKAEGTSTYKKFSVEGESIVGLFQGTDFREFEQGKQTECAIVVTGTGERLLLAQTIVVNELKKKWDETKEIGFPVKIIYKGLVKPGTADQYQNFRLLFEAKK